MGFGNNVPLKKFNTVFTDSEGKDQVYLPLIIFNQKDGNEEIKRIKEDMIDQPNGFHKGRTDWRLAPVVKGKKIDKIKDKLCGRY